MVIILLALNQSENITILVPLCTKTRQLSVRENNPAAMQQDGGG
jgi:hypothetical protein